jgi:hypothetical protein
VVSPLWSDAAAKQRWVILPNDGSHNTATEDIVFDEEGSWVFPTGTVLVKHFEVATNANDPSQIKRLETRFLVCTAGGGKYGVTYRWNSAGTDADLLTTGQIENFPVTLPNGITENRRWDYPSRADCMLCHTATAGQALGVRTSPLNGNFLYDSTAPQINLSPSTRSGCLIALLAPPSWQISSNPARLAIPQLRSSTGCARISTPTAPIATAPAAQ